MKPLKDCEYTAFISYAHADDEAWYGWVTCFRTELERGLQALLRGVRLPRMHLSAENGPVAGVLSEELQKRVAASYAMIIVVHENYAQSSWCLKELEYFKTLFGDDGFRERLYIVALSEAAMLQVSRSEAWKRLLPHDDQLWIPFYDPADKSRPLDIYMAPGLVATSFRTPFERLRGDFAAKLRRAAGRSDGGTTAATAAATRTGIGACRCAAVRLRAAGDAGGGRRRGGAAARRGRERAPARRRCGRRRLRRVRCCRAAGAGLRRCAADDVVDGRRGPPATAARRLARAGQAGRPAALAGPARRPGRCTGGRRRCGLRRLARRRHR